VATATRFVAYYFALFYDVFVCFSHGITVSKGASSWLLWRSRRSFHRPQSVARISPWPIRALHRSFRDCLRHFAKVRNCTAPTRAFSPRCPSVH